MTNKTFIYVFIALIGVIFTHKTFASNNYNWNPFEEFKHQHSEKWSTLALVQHNQKKHYSFIFGNNGNTLFTLSLPVGQCNSESLKMNLFYKTESLNKSFNFESGAYLTAFRQFFGSPTNVYKDEKEGFIQIGFDFDYINVTHFIDSLQQGNILAIIWQDSDLKPLPVEFKLNNSYNSIQKLYTNCMNDAYELKRK